jgi:hypothetical protein
MPPISILKFPARCPTDASPLDELKNQGYTPFQTLAILPPSIILPCVTFQDSTSFPQPASHFLDFLPPTYVPSWYFLANYTPAKGKNEGKNPTSAKNQKQSTAGVRWWSPTQLLTCRHNDSIWLSGREALLSLSYGRLRR